MSGDYEKDCETATLPATEGEPFQKTSQSNSDGTLSQQKEQKEKQPARCSVKKTICASCL